MVYSVFRRTCLYMIELDYLAVAKRLKEQRLKLGYSFQDLAQKTNMSKSTLQRYEVGAIKNIPIARLKSLSTALHIDPNALIGIEQSTSAIPSNAIPYTPTGYAPILGSIPAGLAALAVEDIEGYSAVDIVNPENCFWLRVKGDSMINAGIYPHDLVLIQMQPCADDGQIVACRVNGDESTLKRFRIQGTSIILLPENTKYSPIIVPCSDFDNGNAGIIGVAIEVKRKL